MTTHMPAFSSRDYLGLSKHNPQRLTIGDQVYIQFVKSYASEMPQKLEGQWFVIEELSSQGIPLIIAEGKIRKVRPGHIKSILRDIRE